MNIKEYISSGVLEAYALGELTGSERTEVEKMLVQFPEVREELSKVEETLEAFAMKAAVMPRAEVKEKIFSSVNESSAAKQVTMSSQPFWKYATAASIAIALLTS